MNLHISPNDGTPIYRQITNQVKYMISSGQLQPEDELPPIRTMAEMLVVNANTVARAYRDLEAEGFVTCQRGRGTRVNAVGSPLSDAERTKVLNDRANALISEARQMNMSLEDVIQLVTERADAMNSPEEVQDT
jgi:GntR family transcriptional regulator